ncbi:hydrolase [Paenibacillus sp. P96]|uniref:Hydrolase n=1 Tax=Paenibacillus zeirhizosphaerae TaxID=2987519 RepID=A0ABT9FTJ5_9BACL|nr:HAD family hydrolase [Paenibacillus sp. P96]MDP4098057.1 hydrolase [Paenibacillus sp. P96]
MIFASDLDRTLIYSRKSMGTVPENELVPVELYQGDYISYMTQTSIELLQKLAGHAMFIPVTTRTEEQYKRIFFIEEHLQPKYAVTSNGGKILIDGILDQAWSAHIQHSLKESAAPEEVSSAFAQISSPEWVRKIEFSDELFFSVMLYPERAPIPVIEEFRHRLAAMGWHVSFQGRKLYLVPAGINKGDAVLYIRDVVGARYIASAGDSLLDESLLNISDLALSPRHGELYARKPDKAGVRYTRLSGIKAAEELIAEITTYFLSIQQQVPTIS